jgi:hypothetical protein
VQVPNWEVTSEEFQQLIGLFGPFSVHLFATSNNAKCERFYSRSWEMGTLGIDAFAQSWQGECIFAAPPVSLVMRTIWKAALVKLSGLLIVPLWKNSEFWTYAFRDGILLNAMFESVQIVHMHAGAWEIIRKDAVGGREIQFLCMKFNRSHGSDALESLKGPKRCFRGLFGRVCKGCKAI